MNDRPDNPGSSDDSPEIAEVRRLLADARHAEPMPADVASRLDDVLLDLAAQGSPAPEPTPRPSVIPIAARRRRRAAGMLVAAAAIVVGGVVFSQNFHVSSTESGASGASQADAAQPERLSGGHTKPRTNQLQPTPTPGDNAMAQQSPIVVHPHRFAVDALKGRQLLGKAPAYDRAKEAACATFPRHARVVPAEYQHAPAALVYRRPQGNVQVVDLFVCGSTQPVRSTTLPAP